MQKSKLGKQDGVEVKDRPFRGRFVSTRREVLKAGLKIGVALPLIITLAPSEARAQSSEETS